MEKHIFSYSFSFQQPYTYNMSMNPAYQVNANAMNELARIDFLEEQIQEMNHYPDAEKILKKILDNNS